MNQKTSTQTSSQTKDNDLVFHCQSFDLPLSPLLSHDTRQQLKQVRVRMLAEAPAPPAELCAEQLFQWQCEQYYNSEDYRHLRQRYPVDLQTALIAGVYCEIFTPTAGVSEANRERVLINLHGGGFQAGSRTQSQVESIPVAALGKIKVISIDYRMAPEHSYPAATDDVVAVYQQLLQQYKPQDIGLFGTSAGAVLAAQALVRLQQQKLPQPAAIAMVACGATKFVGDSIEFISGVFRATYDLDLKAYLQLPYYKTADVDNPEVTPSLSDQYMAAFPPSLLASSTRDFQMSSVVTTHRQLLNLGVETELHIWEGLDHAFHYNPFLAETEELGRLIANFLDRYMGGA